MLHLTTESPNRRFAAEAGAAMFTVAYATGAKAVTHLSGRDRTWTAKTTITAGERVSLVILAGVIAEFFNLNEDATVADCFKFVVGSPPSNLDGSDLAAAREARHRDTAMAMHLIVTFGWLYTWAVSSTTSRSWSRSITERGTISTSTWRGV